MESISKNGFRLISFLIRNFSRKLTIRGIASELKTSPTGIHAVLKKLEKDNIVKAEKLGTGLFYQINLENSVAKHLAAIALIDFYNQKIETNKIKKESKSAIFDGKNLLVITSDKEAVRDICMRELNNINLTCIYEEEFVGALKSKEEIREIIRKGDVLFGEDIVINAIEEAIK